MVNNKKNYIKISPQRTGSGKYKNPIQKEAQANIMQKTNLNGGRTRLKKPPKFQIFNGYFRPHKKEQSAKLQNTKERKSRNT